MLSAVFRCFFILHNQFKGKVNIKLLPFPNLLSTQISPLCFSINSLQSIKPRPDPFSAAVPAVITVVSILNNLFCYLVYDILNDVLLTL